MLIHKSSKILFSIFNLLDTEEIIIIRLHWLYHCFLFLKKRLENIVWKNNSELSKELFVPCGFVKTAVYNSSISCSGLAHIPASALNLIFFQSYIFSQKTSLGENFLYFLKKSFSNFQETELSHISGKVYSERWHI